LEGRVTSPTSASLRESATRRTITSGLSGQSLARVLKLAGGAPSPRQLGSGSHPPPPGGVLCSGAPGLCGTPRPAAICNLTHRKCSGVPRSPGFIRKFTDMAGRTGRERRGKGRDRPGWGPSSGGERIAGMAPIFTCHWPWYESSCRHAPQIHYLPLGLLGDLSLQRSLR
jgi:hypothetical protein